MGTRTLTDGDGVWYILAMPRKPLNPVQKRIHQQTQKRLGDFAKLFTGDVKERAFKVRYLNALQYHHFHSFALANTRGLSELIFRRWIREDDNFVEACNVIRLTFVDHLEYAVLCRNGYYGLDRQKRYMNIEVKGMCDFLRIARYHGIYRRLKGNGGGEKGSAAGRVSRDGEGESCSVVEEGSERDLCAIPATTVFPQKP